MSRTSQTPEDLRAILVSAAGAVIDNRITVQQANALAGLSSEIHKSLKMQYVGQLICSEMPTIKDGRVVQLLNAA